ncbi:hypothetical protein [Paenibacillus polymyxa]|nr:hypothetical protein [Paenibacillus polymyxa]
MVEPLYRCGTCEYCIQGRYNRVLNLDLLD